MALGTTNISTSLVAQTIGEYVYDTSGRIIGYSTDVGTLCKSTKINKWSKWKPIYLNINGGITEQDLKDSNCGFYIQSESSADRTVLLDTWVYVTPNGTISSPFRLGDFRNYNHNAEIPFSIEMINNVGNKYLVIPTYQDYMNGARTSYNVSLTVNPNADITFNDISLLKNKYLTVLIGNLIQGSIANYKLYQYHFSLSESGMQIIDIDTSRFEIDSIINRTYDTVIVVGACDLIEEGNDVLSGVMVSLKVTDSTETYFLGNTVYLWDGGYGGERPISYVDYTLSWPYGTPHAYRQDTQVHIDFDMLNVVLENSTNVYYDVYMSIAETMMEYKIGESAGTGYVTNLVPVVIPYIELEGYGITVGSQLTLNFTLQSTTLNYGLIETQELTNIVTIE